MSVLSGLSAPRRTVARRGSREMLAGLFDSAAGPVVLVRGRSQRWADTLADTLHARGLGPLVVVADGEPTLEQLEAARSDLGGYAPQAVVAVGGGSVIDLGKALAGLLPATTSAMDHLEVVGLGRPLSAEPLRFIAVPTTAGTGAEATRNAVIGVAAHRRKVSLRDPRLMPCIAILDADLTDGTPWPVTLAAGMDAITQLIEPFLSSRATPATDLLCRAAIGPAMRALIALSRGEDPEARDTMLRAAHLSGIALANAGLGAVHGLAGVIGGRTGAAHGAICARLLPEVLEANRHACRAAGSDTARFDEVDAIVAEAFGSPGETAATLLRGFVDAQGLPRLAEMGCTPDDAAALAAEAAASSSMKANPVILSPATLVEVIAHAI